MCVCVCVCVCMFVCMYVCMYVCLFVRRLVRNAACMLGLHLLERRLAEVAGPMASGPREEASAKLQSLFRKVRIVVNTER